MRNKFLMTALLLSVATTGNIALAQKSEMKKKASNITSVYSYIPSDYTQLGTTDLYYNVTSNSIDVLGRFSSSYYSSTYSDRGYMLAMQVNDGSATSVDNYSGTTVSGVTCTCRIEQQGEFGRIVYTVTNANSENVTVSLGTRADVKIGNNDRAPISRRIDTIEQTYGVTMQDGNGAQLCVLFGKGLSGVTSVDDFWFGYYYTNVDYYNMVGNYSGGDNYMVENGSYDSGMGWCWKNRIIPAGQSVEFSYLIGVGDVNLEPNSSFVATPDDPEAWNDLSLTHKLTIDGTYDSPAGLDGRIEYAVEDSETWTALTEMIHSGATFSGTIIANFDATKSKHVIKFRTVDNVGNTSLLSPIEYTDISFCNFSGVEDKVFTGDSLLQDAITSDIDASWYTIGSYVNNTNAGTARFSIEGVFPNTIGRKNMLFTISPANLHGTIQVPSTPIYNGTQQRPAWEFSDYPADSLILDKDYTVTYSNNTLPGTATLTLKGKGNYASELSTTFTIDKAQLTSNLYSVVIPEEDINYDGAAHVATSTKADGVGTISFTYKAQDGTTVQQPTEEGSYDVYMSIADGTLYYGKAEEKIGSFAIYRFDAKEYLALQQLYTDLVSAGWACPWNVTAGITAVPSFQGITVEQGRVTAIDLSSLGLTGTMPASLLAFQQMKSLNLSGNCLSGEPALVFAAVYATAPQYLASLQTLDITGNRFCGNIGVLAKTMPALTTLKASGNSFEDVAPMISPLVTTLDISKQKMERVVPLNLDNIDIAEMATTMPSILFYDHANQEYKTRLSIICTEAQPENFSWAGTDFGFQIYCVDGALYMPWVSTPNEFRGNSGDTLNVINLTTTGAIEGSTFRMKYTFSNGDANMISGVTAADLQATINYAFGLYTDLPFNFTAADTYKDNRINVQDVVCSVNILLDQTAEVTPTLEAKGVEAISGNDQYADVTLCAKDGIIAIQANEPVAALSIHTDGKVCWNIQQYDMLQSTSANALVGYSLDGNTIPAGTTIIGTYDDNVNITGFSFADKNAQELSAKVGDINSQPTAVSAAEADSSTSATGFSIDGRATSVKAAHGIVIQKQGGKYIKVVK